MPLAICFNLNQPEILLSDKGLSKVFHDPLVSFNFEGFDPQIFLNLLFTFCNLCKGGHCDPLNKKLRENPG